MTAFGLMGEVLPHASRLRNQISAFDPKQTLAALVEWLLGPLRRPNSHSTRPKADVASASYERAHSDLIERVG